MIVVRMDMRLKMDMKTWVEARMKAEWVPSIYLVEINK
jgi:hypothetical protein